MIIYEFFLLDLYTTTEIQEPRNWPSIKNVLERDFEVHGIFFQFTDGTLELGFTCEAFDILEAAYLEDGTEAFYQFKATEKLYEGATPTTLFLGEIDFSTRDVDSNYFNCQVNKIEDFVKIQNRADLKTSFNKQLTHDNITVSKLNDFQVVLLATKTYRQLRVQNKGVIITQQSTALTTTTVLRGQVGFDTFESTELERFTNIDSIFQEDDVDDFLTLTKRSAITFNLVADFDLNVVEDQGSGTTTYNIALTLISSQPSKEGVSVWNFYNASPSSASPHNYSTTQYFNIGNGPLVFYGGEFEAGTSFKFQMFISMGTTGTAQFTATWTIRNFQLIFVDYAADLGTVARMYHPFDALTKTLNYITGEYDYLYSDLLGDDLRGYDTEGCFSTMRITNGYRVRQIDDDDKTPVQSFNNLIENLNVIGAIGYGIEKLDSFTELVSSSGLNRFDVEWFTPTATYYIIRVYDVDLTSDVTILDTLKFYNSDAIYGAYVPSLITYNASPSYTDISTLIGTRDPQIVPGSRSDNMVIMTNSSTEFKNKLRLEKWEHFYSDTELIDLGVIQDYKEVPFTEALFNEANFGFRKYANDEDKPTTLEDFETRSSWGLPFFKIKKPFNKIMRWVLSTFMINESRGNLFKEKPTTSHKLDDDIFSVDIDSLVIDTTATFVHNASSDDTITVSAVVYENYIRDAAIFVVTNATLPTNNQGHFYDPRETEHILPADNYKIFVSGTVQNDANDPCTITGFVWNGSAYVTPNKAESTEKLSSVSGLSSPDYTYNLRRTMKRFLIRWGRYFNSILAYLVDDDVQTIQNLEYFNNGTVTTELDTAILSADCLMGDTSNDVIREDNNVQTSILPDPKFKPNLISGTIKICDEDYQMILDAHQNYLQSPNEAKNYGYFTVQAPGESRFEGKISTGWLMNLKRNPIDRISNIQILERVVVPKMLFDGTKYGLLGYHVEFELQDFEIEWSGKWTDTNSNRIFGINRQASSTNNSGMMEYAIPSSGFNVFQWEISSIASNNATHSVNPNTLIDQDVTIVIKKYGTTFEWAVNETQDNGTISDALWYDNTNAETVLGANWIGVVANLPFIGVMYYWKLHKLDGSGNRTESLIEILAENDNGTTVQNTATDAPTGSDLVWYTI